MFPDLDEDTDFPGSPLSMHQSPDGSMYWIAGQNGVIKKVRRVLRAVARTRPFLLLCICCMAFHSVAGRLLARFSSAELAVVYQVEIMSSIIVGISNMAILRKRQKALHIATIRAAS